MLAEASGWLRRHVGRGNSRGCDNVTHVSPRDRLRALSPKASKLRTASPEDRAPADLRTLFLRQCSRLGATTVAYALLADNLGIACQITYEELQRRVFTLAYALAARCEPGERVLLAFDNGLESIELFWACIVAGAVPIPAPAPAPRQFAEIGYRRLQGIAADAGASLVVTTADQLAKLPLPVPDNWVSYEALDGGLATAPPDVTVSESDLAYLQYTSGSTSEPRGVELTHANVLHHCAVITRTADSSTEPVSSLNWLPWFHDFGLVQGVIAPLYKGATSYLMPTVSFMRRPLSWLEGIAKYRVSHSGGPDTAYLSCVRALARRPNWTADLGSWSLATSGGEPVRADTVQAFLRAFAPHGFRSEAFAPAYGMAEAVLAVSLNCEETPPRFLRLDSAALERNEVCEAPGHAADAKTLVGCGAVLDGLDLRIVDAETGVERAPNRVGEIWVRGLTIGQGYWGKPDESREAFGAELAGSGERFLRTGDLGFLHDGQLYISGRRKDLIVVHGRNLYPQDIEHTAEAAHDAVREGGVIAVGIERSVGEAVVLLAECSGRPGEAAIRDLAERIRREVSAEHGVEVHDVVVLKRGALPQTSSGKPQRAVARQRYLAGGFEGERLNGGPAVQASRDPADATERVVADAWMAVLGLDRCNVDDDFFLQGGNSLTATQLVSRLKAACGVDLAIRSVFEAPTIAGLARKIRDEAGRSVSSCVDRGQGGETVLADATPLSFSQERMWFIHQQAPESPAYHMPLALRLRGPVDADAMEAAFARVIERHDILRTTFETTASGVEPRVHLAMHVPLRRVALSAADPAARAEELERLLARLTHETFDFERGPLMRTYLVELGAGEAVLLIVMHHIIGDQWSFAVLARELAHFYRAALGAEVGPLPPLVTQYADYAAWQRSTFAGARREREEAYWEQELADLEPFALASDAPRPNHPLYRGGRVRVPLDPGLVKELTALGARHGASLSMVMMAALDALLHRHSGRTDISFGVPIANRNHARSEALIGTFVNMLVLRSDVDSGQDFASLLRQVRQRALDAFAHQDMPFELLVRALKHQRDASRAPLFNVLFNMINTPVGKLDFGGLEVSRFDFDREATQFDLAVMVDAEHDFSIGFEYAAELFERETMERLASHYERVLRAVAASETVTIAALPMMDAEEAARMSSFGRGRDLVLRAETIPAWLAPAFERNSDEPAVVFQGRATSYGELGRAADEVARALRARGIGRGDRVGLYAVRSVEMLVAQLGILKSGGAYVPLDPINPAARLRYMAGDAGLGLILTHAPEGALADWASETSRLDVGKAISEGADLARTDDAWDVSRDAGPDDAAYILYTSGSTGEPKGVVVPHRPVVNLLASVEQEPGLAASDRILAVTTLSFDISITETLLPLGAGAQIVLAGSDEIADGAALWRLIDEHGVTVVQATPSTWYLLLAAGWPGSPWLKTAIVTGEPLPPDLAMALRVRCEAVWNMYGPTETTVWSTGGLVADPAGERISIGRPIANTQVYVLDAGMRRCPIGVEGELFIGGLGVSAGYLKRPELTAERFLADPFFPSDGQARLYRTGDRALWRKDGMLLHLGRSDSQVKIRGYRIELAEIEAALARHPQVSRAAVDVRDFGGDKRLVAYVASGAEPAGREALRDHLRALLPDYMVPQHFTEMEALPLLGSGKIDRKQLAAGPLPDLTIEAATPPRNLTEQAIWEIWREVLGTERFGVHENFFDLGGHSMLAVRVVNRIRADISPRCTLPLFFQNPTIAGLGAAMSMRPHLEQPSLVSLQEQGEGPPLFCICGIRLYQELADQLAPHTPVYAIFVPCELGILNGDADERSRFISVETLAADYLVEVRKKQPHGPYSLAGLSFGGLLAYEMAQQLRRAGEEVAFLAMFDTVMPERKIRTVARRALHHVQMFPKEGVMPGFVRGRARFSELISAFAGPAGDAFPVMNILDVQDARRAALRDTIYARAARRYKVKPYDGTTVLFRADDSKTLDTTARWRAVVRNIDVQHVPGDHLDVLKAPHVSVVARQILKRLKLAPSSSRMLIG